MRYQYLRNPEEIYHQSFKIIDELVDVSAYPINNAAVIKRMVHACGVPDICDSIHCHKDFANSAIQALKKGTTVIGDCEMVLAGMMQKHAPASTQFLCTLNHPEVAAMAKSLHTTRSAAAVDLWNDNLDQAIIVIGNAPTALFRLLEVIHGSQTKPAAIIGLPVGFVGAAESKQALIAANIDIPYITLSGRMGGSAMASAALNALLMRLK